MAIDSPNGSANLKLTTLLCKRKNGVVFSKCLKKSILNFVSLLFNVRSFVEFLLEGMLKLYVCVWGNPILKKSSNSKAKLSLCPIWTL